MNLKENFKELYNKYIKGTILKSLLYSLLVSTIIVTILSLIFWFLDIHKYYISIVVFIASLCMIFALFYLVYKPNDKRFSVKIDDLGLKQRAITMNEYKDDDSIMARIQRSNAIEHIKGIDNKLLKIAIPRVVLVLTIVFTCLATFTTTVAGLSSKDIIQNGKDTIEDIIPGLKSSYELSYDEDGEGIIDGEIFQVVEEGEDGTPVTAIGLDGYVFVKWSDEITDPYRIDTEIKENLNLIAIFQELDDEEQDGEGDGEGEPSDEESQGEPQEGEGEGSGEGEPSDYDSEEEGGGAGGQYDENNQVIDGETYYGNEVYDNAYSDAIESMTDASMSEGEKSIISDYFDTIEK